MSAAVEKDKDLTHTSTQLRSLLSRFINKVLDRDPTLTRDTAMEIFKQALSESGSGSGSSSSSSSCNNNNNGSGSLKGDKIGSGGGADDGKLLLQIPEMIDVIQTDFLFSLSVSVKAYIKQNTFLSFFLSKKRSVLKVSKSLSLLY